MKRTLIALFLVASILSHARTITAVSSGNWVLPATWNCNCTPSNGDRIVIPQGITVSITRPVAVLSTSISLAGKLDLTNGLLQIGSSDNITVLPGGKIIANGLGGVVYAGLIQHIIEKGKVIQGPVTIGSSMLPIALMFFEAGEDEGHVVLNWSSIGEIEVDHYEIFTSRDSASFVNAGEVRGTKYSLQRRDYNFRIDGAAEVEFYRLEAVTTDSARMVLSTIVAK